LELDAEDDAFKQQLERLPQYLQTAAEIDCTRCVAMIEPAGDKRPYHENFEYHRHRLSDVAKVLEPAGIRLGIGFRAAEDLRKGQAFQFIHEIEALTLLVKMVDAPNLGMLLDTWDLYVSGGSPEQVRGLSGEQIVAIRVADQPEDAPADEITEAARVLPCPTGRVDVAGYLAAFAETGFDGPVTPAPARSSLQGMRRDPIVQKASRALAEIWQAAGLTPEGKLPVAAES
jgi:sugar phosphate isomerase/epimerase